MDTKEALVIIIIAIIIALFASMIAPVEIEGSAVVDLDTKFVVNGGGTVYTMGLNPLFDGKSELTLDKNTSLTLGINKTSVNWRIKTPIFGLWLFKDDIRRLIGG